jgi:transposase
MRIGGSMASQYKDFWLAKDEKALLQSWQYSESVPSAFAMRAKAVLSINEGKSIAAVSRSLGFSRPTVYKWLNRYASGDPNWYKGKSCRPHHIPLMLNEIQESAIISEANTLLCSNRKPNARCIQAEILKQQSYVLSRSTIQRVINLARKRGLLQQPLDHLYLDFQIQQTLLSLARRSSAPSYLARRVKMILLKAKGTPDNLIARQLNCSVSEVEKWLRRFNQYGLEGLHSRKAVRIRKDQDGGIISEVFSLLHSPPIEHGINRTSWRMIDLKNYLGKKGLLISQTVIRKVLKTGGYRWRKARKVLTSPDPEYRQKLDEVKRVLSHLGTNERFFFIDEFGPCAIGKRGGKKLVAPREDYIIPQFQHSKGRLIMTAALEMSSNQVTHFYSNRKNTLEIIKLIEVLIQEYTHAATLYLSWDAASWHDSKMLIQRLEQHNNEIESGHKGPLLKVVPLPKCAQFLNVIESIFSGLAKAVIHNSNYESESSAKQAIDRYFEERNTHYQLYPKRAGKTLWGQELVTAEFDEGQNCKDPRW